MLFVIFYLFLALLQSFIHINGYESMKFMHENYLFNLSQSFVDPFTNPRHYNVD